MADADLEAALKASREAHEAEQARFYRAPSGGAGAAAAFENVEWMCNGCTFRQTNRLTKCEICGTARPAAKPKPKPAPAPVMASSLDMLGVSVDARPAAAPAKPVEEAPKFRKKTILSIPDVIGDFHMTIKGCRGLRAPNGPNAAWSPYIVIRRYEPAPTGVLRVTVRECKDLSLAKPGTSSAVVAKFLNGAEQQSKVRMNAGRTPKFNHQFTFNLTGSENEKFLYFHVMGKGVGSRDEELGVAKLNMKEVLSRTRSSIEFWDTLSRGQLMMGGQPQGMIQTSYERHEMGKPPLPPLHPLEDDRIYTQRLVLDSKLATLTCPGTGSDPAFNKTLKYETIASHDFIGIEIWDKSSQPGAADQNAGGSPSDGVMIAETGILSIRHLLQQAIECDNTRNWYPLTATGSAAAAAAAAAKLEQKTGLPAGFIELAFKFTTFSDKDGLKLKEQTILEPLPPPEKKADKPPAAVAVAAAPAAAAAAAVAAPTVNSAAALAAVATPPVTTAVSADTAAAIAAAAALGSLLNVSVVPSAATATPAPVVVTPIIATPIIAKPVAAALAAAAPAAAPVAVAVVKPYWLGIVDPPIARSAFTLHDGSVQVVTEVAAPARPAAVLPVGGAAAAINSFLAENAAVNAALSGGGAAAAKPDGLFMKVAASAPAMADVLKPNASAPPPAVKCAAQHVMKDYYNSFPRDYQPNTPINCDVCAAQGLSLSTHYHHWFVPAARAAAAHACSSESTFHSFIRVAVGSDVCTNWDVCEVCAFAPAPIASASTAAAPGGIPMSDK